MNAGNEQTCLERDETRASSEYERFPDVLLVLVQAPNRLATGCTHYRYI